MEISRIKTAVAFLNNGQSFKVCDLRLGMNGKNDMYVTGWSQFLNLENLTRSQALKELNAIKSLFKQMVDLSQELEAFIQDKRIEYNHAFNYGMGAICICSEKEGVVEWGTDLK